MRIIGGRFRGRDLGPVPDGVRPTSDRVRESLFSMLGPIDDAQVLDLFAGTGALGIEALSRGAAEVVFVDLSRRVLRRLRERMSMLDLDEGEDFRMIAADAKKAIGRLAKEQPAPFDLVFMDAPYEEGDRVGTLEALFASGILSERARVVVEGPKRHPLPALAGVRVLDERDYGETRMTWLTPSAATETSESKEQR